MGSGKDTAANVFLPGAEEKTVDVIGIGPTADTAVLAHCSVRE